LFCTGKGPFRWAALSGDPDASASPTARCWKLFPDDAVLPALAAARRGEGAVPGPAGAHLLARLWRARQAGLLFNSWCARARPGAARHRRDHLDTGSVASPYRETEAMKDGSDAIADWPL
jgi:urocanate hydratase